VPGKVGVRHCTKGVYGNRPACRDEKNKANSKPIYIGMSDTVERRVNQEKTKKGPVPIFGIGPE